MFLSLCMNEDLSLCAGQCGSSEFWNSDLDVCVPCSSCKLYPKTPSCNTCKRTDPCTCKWGHRVAQSWRCVFETGKSVEDTPDVWKLAAITSFSVLAVVLIGAALIIGVMVHRRKSHKRPLRGETLQRSDFMRNPTQAVSYPKSQKTTWIKDDLQFGKLNKQPKLKLKSDLWPPTKMFVCFILYILWLNARKESLFFFLEQVLWILFAFREKTWSVWDFWPKAIRYRWD